MEDDGCGDSDHGAPREAQVRSKSGSSQVFFYDLGQKKAPSSPH